MEIVMKLLVLLLLAPALSFATTVRIMNDNKSMGSGWAIQTSKGLFILTSEHILTDKTPTVQFRGKHFVTKAVYMDWARGVAVLKVEQPPEGMGVVISDEELRRDLRIKAG